MTKSSDTQDRKDAASNAASTPESIAKDDSVANGSDDVQDCASDDANSCREKNTHHNYDLGVRGEKAAARFLENKGYEILERRWTCPGGEADIIARDDDGLHFIEVKTRMSTRTGFPEEAVDKRKRERYERIAEFYLAQYEGPECRVMFDVISILVVGEDRAFLRFHRNAYAEGE